MSTEQDGNQNMGAPMFCLNGCGFYAAQAFEGMCSKCYRDFKQPQDMAAAQSSSVISRSSILSAGYDSHDVAVAMSKATLDDVRMATASSHSCEKAGKLEAAADPGVETGAPTVTASEATDDTACATGEGEKSKKPKKNRCMECRKRVGLTGFVCHCGSLFCSLHRYSDAHNCTFDFREKGQEEIRRNNPVVRAEKIQRI